MRRSWCFHLTSTVAAAGKKDNKHWLILSPRGGGLPSIPLEILHMNTNEHGYLRMLASASRGRNYAHNIPLLRIRGSWWRCTFWGGVKTVCVAALKNSSTVAIRVRGRLGWGDVWNDPSVIARCKLRDLTHASISLRPSGRSRILEPRKQGNQKITFSYLARLLPINSGHFTFMCVRSKKDNNQGKSCFRHHSLRLWSCSHVHTLDK